MKKIKIIEVGPRDGLQNEKTIIQLNDKIRFIELLSLCGFDEIEIGSFVNPQWVPQMADTQRLFEHFNKTNHPSLVYSALVPNSKGLDVALQCGVKKISLFTAASDAFTQKNINCSIEESFQRFLPVLKIAHANHLQVRCYVSTAFYCPYSGEIAVSQVLDVVQKIVDLGIVDISLGDTIGKATPKNVAALLDELLKRYPVDYFAMHFHDTYGTALSNVLESLRHGVFQYDSSAGGLGGCPYAVGASGNVATNDLVWFLENMGYVTGIDFSKLNAASFFIQTVLQKQLPSKVLQNFS